MIRPSSTAEAETHFAIQRAASLAACAHVFPPELYPFPDEAVRRRWREFSGRTFVADDNARARRFYERRGWRLNGETRVVPFPPSPLDVGYHLVREEP